MSFNNINMSNTMYVTKRDGSLEEVSFGKCQTRITNMTTVVEPILKNVNSAELTQQVVIQMSNQIWMIRCIRLLTKRNNSSRLW